ncbi:MAG: hypothetical protein K2L73_00610 [Muribaculaceae bacterium]|nr:hypothetical protein [Muribaculaceae bacterium]
MKVEIMTQKVLEDIYAQSALRGYVNLPERERALLQEDQMEGLMILVEDAWAEMVMELIPRIEDYAMPSVGTGGSMWIQIKDEYAVTGLVAGPVGAVAQRTLACMVMGAVYESLPEGKLYARQAEKGIAMMRETIDNAGPTPHLQGYR